MHRHPPARRDPAWSGRIPAPVALFILMTLGGCAIQQSGGTADSGPVPRDRFETVRSELEAARQEIAQLRLQLAQVQQQNERITRNAQRLQADIQDAEEALVTLESGLKGLHTRADAVSALADARIVVTRAAQRAPWRRQSIEQAREKLAEAERHIEEEYFGSAVFFTVRGRRIAEEVLALARELREDPDTRFIGVNRANVRASSSTDADIVTVLEQGTPVHIRDEERDWIRVVTPANEDGWIHGSLLTSEP